ncbi:MAG: hypothetical protein AAGI90_03990 [Chlamydiota bacterium]
MTPTTHRARQDDNQELIVSMQKVLRNEQRTASEKHKSLFENVITTLGKATSNQEEFRKTMQIQWPCRKNTIAALALVSAFRNPNYPSKQELLKSYANNPWKAQGPGWSAVHFLCLDLIQEKNYRELSNVLHMLGKAPSPEKDHQNMPLWCFAQMRKSLLPQTATDCGGPDTSLSSDQQILQAALQRGDVHFACTWLDAREPCPKHRMTTTALTAWLIKWAYQTQKSYAQAIYHRYKKELSRGFLDEKVDLAEHWLIAQQIKDKKTTTIFNNLINSRYQPFVRLGDAEYTIAYWIMKIAVNYGEAGLAGLIVNFFRQERVLKNGIMKLYEGAVNLAVAQKNFSLLMEMEHKNGAETTMSLKVQDQTLWYWIIDLAAKEPPSALRKKAFLDVYQDLDAKIKQCQSVGAPIFVDVLAALFFLVMKAIRLDDQILDQMSHAHLNLTFGGSSLAQTKVKFYVLYNRLAALKELENQPGYSKSLLPKAAVDYAIEYQKDVILKHSLQAYKSFNYPQSSSRSHKMYFYILEEIIKADHKSPAFANLVGDELRRVKEIAARNVSIRGESDYPSLVSWVLLRAGIYRHHRLAWMVLQEHVKACHHKSLKKILEFLLTNRADPFEVEKLLSLGNRVSKIAMTTFSQKVYKINSRVKQLGEKVTQEELEAYRRDFMTLRKGTVCPHNCQDRFLHVDAFFAQFSTKTSRGQITRGEALLLPVIAQLAQKTNIPFVTHYYGAPPLSNRPMQPFYTLLQGRVYNQEEAVDPIIQQFHDELQMFHHQFRNDADDETKCRWIRQQQKAPANIGGSVQIDSSALRADTLSANPLSRKRAAVRLIRTPAPTGIAPQGQEKKQRTSSSTDFAETVFRV